MRIRCAVTIRMILWGAAMTVGIAAAATRPVGADCVPDDLLDDAEAINKALAAAQPGDTVTLPAGVLRLFSPLTPPSGVTLQGAGQERTILAFGGEKPHEFVRMRDVSGVQVCHLTLDGGSNPLATQGVVAMKCDTLCLHHLTIRDFVDTGTFGPHGILLSQTSDSVIRDNTICNIAPEDPWGAGIRVSDRSLRAVIERNVIDRTGRGGIFTNNGASDAVIRENVVTRSGGIGFAIEVHSESVRTLVEDNVVDHGLSIVSSHCAVRRNLVADAGGTWKAYGIEGGGGPYGIVTDNVIHYGQIEGISVSGASHHMLWAHNRFVCCSMWGMQLQGPSASNHIHSLYFYDNLFTRTQKGHPSVVYKGADGHAIRINNHTTHVTFDGNQITDNGGMAFQILGKNVNHLTFIRNVIANNAGASIRTYLGDAVVWEDNLVSGNKTNVTLTTCGEMGAAPVAAFDAPETARAGEPVAFRDTSVDPEGIAQRLWDFGDGLPCLEAQPKHVYRKPGAYRVTLVVWNASKRAALAERIVRVYGE
ncbi:MAG TPA: right-handed parallel beta-helix repeat-containing protein [Kiritimatiellia bacterium]|jgi:hypothetical protein|nr:right-handed parallel beta-helix repeat-containing protein [Kiritimatiellia bacterium]HOR97672.1 right-handed parallel beta-helix repeat-containing protein [Kiritimatiellia bacterium]HPC49246.1 right-handed parallel beta-helix repeat-containing protein [Kiritimatiellia bacterium]HPK37596.1 right-handed parallel beta-helix repeat-containing protein [Kiritimatiellia bacterium]HPW74827.1 right-handed parallel beta-helix repeat-containing protein [Kiritimatiellia bacterium]